MKKKRVSKANRASNLAKARLALLYKASTYPIISVVTIQRVSRGYLGRLLCRKKFIEKNYRNEQASKFLDEITPPINEITPQLLVNCSGVTSLKNYMTNVPDEIFRKYGYTYNESQNVWRSSDCTKELVVKGKGNVNRCHNCHKKHNNYRRDERDCLILLKNVSRPSEEKTVADYLRILQRKVEDAVLRLNDDELAVFLKDFFIKNPKVGPYSINDKFIGPCSGFVIKTKKAHNIKQSIEGSMHTGSCEGYYVKKRNFLTRCQVCTIRLAKIKKQNEQYEQSKFFSPKNLKNPSNAFGNVNWNKISSSVKKIRLKSLKTIRSNINRKLNNAIMKLKQERDETTMIENDFEESSGLELSKILNDLGQNPQNIVDFIVQLLSKELKDKSEGFNEQIREIAVEIVDQIRNHAKRFENKPKTVRYSQRIMRLALSIWLRSPSAYEEVMGSNTVPMPSVSTLKRTKRFYQIRSGYDTKVYENIAPIIADLKPRSVHGGLLCDEMKLKVSFRDLLLPKQIKSNIFNRTV